ncbi:MAG: matrixin family metalloprotease [Vicinamibacteria bacterium]
MRLHSILIATLLLASARDGAAYKLIEYTNANGQLRHLFWGPENLPVPWFFYNVPPDDFSVDVAISRTQVAFDTWEAVETASITFQFSGQTNAEPFVFFDSVNTLGFITDESLQGTGVLAATDFIVFTSTGEIAESDIFLNADVPWSASASGEPGRFDFQATALHEIGHFLGLHHSALAFAETRGGRHLVQEGSAVMFPIAFPPGMTTGRTLTLDDITGVSLLYPVGDFVGSHASLSGQVTKDGEGLRAAHVTVFNPFTEELIGAFTDGGGHYRVDGLSSGPIVVRVHPISDATSPEDYGFDEFSVDLDWRVTFHEGRAEVTSGSNTSGVDVEVMPCAAAA